MKAYDPKIDKANAKELEHAAWHDKVSKQLSKLESCLKNSYHSINNTQAIGLIINSFQRFSLVASKHIDKIAVALMLFGVGFFIHSYLSDYSYFDSVDNFKGWQKFSRLENATFIIFSGLIIYFRQSLINPEASNVNYNIANTELIAHTRNNYLLFFGYFIDVFVFQAILILLIVILHNDHLSVAYALALTVSVLGYFISRIGYMIYGMYTLIVGVSYIVYREMFFNFLNYANENLIETLSRSQISWVFHNFIDSYFLILILSIAIPQSQLLRISSLKYGKLRGDLTLNFMGHKVFIPLGSALVFYLLWCGISQVFLTIRFYIS